MKVVTAPADVLLERCTNIVVPVIERDTYEALVADMIDLMRRERGVGLAAPQVGVPKRLVIVDPDLTGTPIVMCNPIRNGIGVEWKWGEEGCLSIPGRMRRIRRRQAVNVEWRTLDGDYRSRRFDGWAARAIQHELDHLEGVLITSHGRDAKPRRRR